MMRKALFALAMVFLVSMASAYAQTAKQDDALPLKKDKTQPSVQAAGAPAVHPAAGVVIKPIAKRPAPSPSPVAQKSPRPGGASVTQQPRFGNAPARTPQVGAAKVRVPGSTRGSRPAIAANRGNSRTVRPNRIRTAPAAMDPNDPLNKLYEARRLLNRLSTTDPIDTRKEAYVEARQLVSQAIRTINAARGGP